MINKKIITIFIFTLVVSLSVFLYYLFSVGKIKVGNSIHITGKSQKLQNVSFVTKSPIPENENNIEKVRGEVVEYEPDNFITIDYFEDIIKVKIEPTYTLYYQIYSDPKIPNKLEPSFEEDYSKYIKVGKYVTVTLKEQLREASTLVARQIFIWDPEK